MIILSWVLAPFFKKFKKTLPLKLGIVCKLVFVCTIVFFQEFIVDYVYLIAICNGFAEVMFWGGGNPLQSEVGKVDNLQHFISGLKIMNTVINLVVPIIMGYFIDLIGLKSIAIAMLVCVAGQMTLAFFVKDTSTIDNTKLRYKEFLKKAKQENILVKPIYINNLIYGLCTNMSMLILYYTIITFGSNLSIGIFSSIAAVVATLILIIYNWKEKLFKNNITPIVSAVLMVFSITFILITLNQVSLIIFYAAWNISIIIPETITNTTRLNIIKNSGFEDYNIENVTISEIYLDFGRAIGEVLILLMAIINSTIFNTIALISITLVVVFYFIHTNILSKKSQV